MLDPHGIAVIIAKKHGDVGRDKAPDDGDGKPEYPEACVQAMHGLMDAFAHKDAESALKWRDRLQQAEEDSESPEEEASEGDGDGEEGPHSALEKHSKY
jgi:hypothetical protein